MSWIIVLWIAGTSPTTIPGFETQVLCQTAANAIKAAGNGTVPIVKIAECVRLK